MTHHLITRATATEATLAYFRDAPMALGTFDCAQMVAFHVRLLGHDPRIAAAGSYESVLGAKKALARCGWSSLADALDAHGFARIAPAAALIGDVIELEAENKLGALTIAVGNGRVFGYYDGQPCVMQPKAFVRAWRVLGDE